MREYLLAQVVNQDFQGSKRRLKGAKGINFFAPFNYIRRQDKNLFKS